MKKLIIVLITLFVFCSCEEKLYKTGHFPDDVINFADVNSEYDDYNSDLKEIRGLYILRFSTNRNSNGNNFDIIAKQVNIRWHQKTGKLSIYAEELSKSYEYEKAIDSTLNIINTQDNELGPYSMFIPYSDLLLYANDSNGNYDIKFIDNPKNSVSDINFLKTDANELYPSFYGKDVFFNSGNYDKSINYINEIEKLIYCSDKDGNFDIYEVSLPSNLNVVEALKSAEIFESVKIDINSSSDDKCPFVNGKLLFFSSNRAGGFGGFDLYYSINTDGKWNEPVNFGEKINSPYDEYRPVTLHIYGFENNLLLFSSNRPGGKGEFDLYYTGIKQMIK